MLDTIISKLKNLLYPSLRLRLMELIVFALLPVVLVLGIMASQNRRKAIEDIHQNALFIARLAASNQQQLIDGAKDILITLSQLPAIQNNDRQACLFFLTNVLMQHPLYANFGAADKDGNIFCMTLPQRVPINIRDESYFQTAIKDGDFAISEYKINPSNSRAIVTLSYPIMDNKLKPNGIVFAELDLRWLEQFEFATDLPPGVEMRVIDQEGKILAQYPKGDEAIGRVIPEREVVTSIITQREGLLQSNEIAGGNRVYAFTPLAASSGTELYIVISLPTEAILAEPTRQLTYSLLALATGAILAIVLGWFISDYLIVRQVNELVVATRQLGKGHLEVRARELHYGDELSELAKAFNEMASILQKREMEHQWSQEQIRKQTQRAEALAHIAARLNAYLELPAVLEAICEEVIRVMNVPAVMILLADSGVGKTDRYFKTVIPHPFLNQILEELPFPAILQAENREVLFISSVESTLQSLNLPKDALPFCEMIIVAMKHKEKLIGYLNVFFANHREDREDEMILLKGIAEESALAIMNAHLYQALRHEEQARAKLLSSLITAQEDERMRIARELHDETSQSLNALLVGLDVLRISIKSDPERIETHLHNLKKITEEMLTNIHRLIANLRPALLDDLGLVAAISWYADLRLSPAGIGFEFDYDFNTRLPPSIETTFFRITQEAITNIVRHANATEVHISLTESKDGVTLSITDNGVGFDTQILQHPDPPRGLGLRGMLERTNILGGYFELQSAPGRGTRIVITLPNSRVKALYG